LLPQVEGTPIECRLLGMMGTLMGEVASV
jgi:hypothetical protein